MRRVAILLPALIVVVVASASFLMLSRTKAVQNPTLSLDMVIAGNGYDGTVSPQTMTVGTIDNCLTEMPGNDAAHNVQAQLIVQNVEDIAGAQIRINHDDTKAEVTNVNWGPFQDTATLAFVGFLNLPIDPLSNDHAGLTGAFDGAATNTSLAAQSYVGNPSGQTLGMSPDTPPKPVSDGNTSYSAPTGGILGTVVINVKAGQVGQPSLAIDLDDGVPNAPGSSVDILTGAGIVKMNLLGFQLGDGFIGEGVTCVPGAAETAPPATPTPTLGSGTPTPTPTATTGGGGGGAGGSASPTGAGARTGTPRTSPAASPAALPPTGSSTDGGSSAWVYALLLGAAITASASGAYGLYRLRKR